MSTPAGDSEPKKKLPGRDWILLPAVGLLTIAVLAGATEMAARWAFPTWSQGLLDCFPKDNPTGDLPVHPNCTCSERITESKYTVEYKFNSLGNRENHELEPKKPGTYRIVLIGSSMTMGLFVPKERTFAALLPEQLSQATGRKIEVYNEAPGGKFRGGTYPTRDSVAQFDKVLAAQPDMILWVITPWDAVNAGFNAAAAPAAPTGPAPQRTLADRLNYRWELTRSSIVLKHLLLANDSQDEYVRSYLRNEDFAGFLRAAPGPKWDAELKAFDDDVTQIQAKAQAAGVPFVAVLVPNRAQAAMISEGKWPEGYDPYKLDHALRDVVVRNGGTYLDILPDYSTIPSPEQNYFPVDGHPDSDGHAVIAKLLTRELSAKFKSGAIPAAKPDPTAEESKVQKP
jgi:hypothetical protein